MKQTASVYTYNKTNGVITLTGVNIDRDQLLLIVNTTRNVTYYNFADSTTTLQAFTQGVNTSVTLATSVVSASSAHTNADALTIYYDDQSGTNSNPMYVGLAGNLSGLGDGDGNIFGLDRSFPIDGSVTATDLGVKADAVATTDTGTFSVIAFIKRGLQNWTSLLAKIPALVSGRIPVDGSGVTQPVSFASPPSVYPTQPPSSTSRISVQLVDASGNQNYGTTGTSLSVKTDLAYGSSQPCVAVAFDSPAGVQRVGNTNAFPIRPMQDGSGNSIPLPISAGSTSFFVSGEDVYAHRSVLYSSSGNGFNNDAGAPVDIENPLPIKETQPTGDYVINTGTAGLLSLSGSVVTTAGFDAGTTADYVAVTLEGGGSNGAFIIDLSPDNANWTSGTNLGVYYDIQANSATDIYSHKTVIGTLFGGTRSAYSGRFLVSCAQSTAGSSGNTNHRYVRITSPNAYGSWRYKFSSYKSITKSIGLSNPGGLARVTGRVDVGCVSTLPAITATVTQATATNLRSASEAYQGGTAVGSANPLQVTLANTGANATAVKIDGSAVTQPISGSVTIGSILDSSNQNIIQQGGGVRSVLRVRDNSGTYGDLQGSGVNVFNVPIYGTVTANTGLTQPLTNAELRATVVPTEVYTGGSAVGSSNALTIKTTNAYGSNLPTVVIGYNQTGAGVLQPSDTSGFPIRPSSSAIFKASIAQATTPAVTTFTSITSATLIASNTSRSMLTIQNTGSGILYVLFGTGVASATNFSLQMNSGDFYECNYYNGQVNAIFATAGTAYVTSLT